MKLVEAEKAMGEDDGILGGLCEGLGDIWQEMRWDPRYLARMLA